MKKMRLDLDELVVEAFPTTDSEQGARGTVRGHSGQVECEPAPGEIAEGVQSFYYDPFSYTGGLDYCICPRLKADSIDLC
jgi:hypothetical protein